MRDYRKDKEFMDCVRDIYTAEIFRREEEFIQHGTTTTFDHSLDVAYMTFLICKERGWDARAGARAGMLHDFFLYDWHKPARETGGYFHGFTHPFAAARNAKRYFRITPKEENMIKTHMFPLTLLPPLSKEGWVLTYADKYCTCVEFFKRLLPSFGGA